MKINQYSQQNWIEEICDRLGKTFTSLSQLFYKDNDYNETLQGDHHSDGSTSPEFEKIEEYEEITLSPFTQNSAFTKVSQTIQISQDDNFDSNSQPHQMKPFTQTQSNLFSENTLFSKNQQCTIVQPIPLKLGYSNHNLLKKPQYIIPNLHLSEQQIIDFKHRLSIIQKLVQLFTREDILDILKKDRDDMSFHRMFRIFFFNLLESIGDEKEEFLKYIHDNIDEKLVFEINDIINQLNDSTSVIQSNPELIFHEFPEEKLMDVVGDLDIKKFSNALSLLQKDKFETTANFYQEVGLLLKVEFCVRIQQGEQTTGTLTYGELKNPIITLPVMYTTGHFSIHSNMFFTPRDGNCFFHLIAQYLIAITESIDHHFLEKSASTECTTTDSRTSSIDTEHDQQNNLGISLFDFEDIPDLFKPLHEKAIECHRKIFIHYINEIEGHSSLEYTLGAKQSTEHFDLVYNDKMFYYCENLKWNIIDNPLDLFTSSAVKNTA